ncbi:DNA polymerase III subunit gamma/tau [[Mycoplasma] mobile]|uniref:DNA polymerase III subunit gamma/tau n=1 Tax=Mycoplasma mobile (strain ATCC 43663 / 163K / NCTC 11711) TaxID=267748 RepID=Q6KIL7_MYCM1|nr:DNA polymerase III subunit gamma/tau [[Mycoplasma] mobile]AAT27559.1 DNA polymerase III subunit gamma and tau [Mycoplasma mobile 163K]
MDYKALYRKYRPKNFDEIKGQDHIVTTLKNILNFDKLSHAYLFSGPRGTGKTSVAKIFAAALNCEHEIQKEKICNLCVENLDNNLDIIEIDAASNNGVDEIRELREKVKYSPSQYKYKVYIIDEAHMLTKSAFNALLKTLEEPPKHAIFILATTDPQKIPLTVISRVQRFNFKRITLPILEKQLQEVLTKENIRINKNALTLIAKMAEGGLRDALSIADQISIFSNNNITEKEVDEVFSLVSIEDQIYFLNLIYKKDTTTVLRTINNYIESGINIEKLVINLIDIIRDFIVFNKTHASNLLEYLNEEDLKELEIDIHFAYQTKDALMPLLSDLKHSEIPTRNFEIIILQLLHESKRDEILEQNKKNSLSEFFKNEDTQPIHLADSKVKQKNENAIKFTAPTETFETEFSSNDKKNSNKSFLKNEMNSITNTDKLLEETTQSINLENENLNEYKQINEHILSTDILDLENIIIDTGEIDLNDKILNQSKIDFFENQDEEFFSFDNSKNETFENEEYSNEQISENSTIKKILNQKENKEIASNDPSNLQELDITDLVKEKNSFQNQFFNDLNEVKIVNLLMQTDPLFLKECKDIWKNLFSYKTDQKFNKEILYLENTKLIAASEKFIMVSADDDNLITKLIEKSKENNFNMFIEKITKGPKHFFAITKKEFKESRKMWNEINEQKRSFKIEKLSKPKSFDNSKEKTEEFARNIFGDTLEIKK